MAALGLEMAAAVAAAGDRLAALDRLIAVLEERRVEQMLHIAFLMADEADTTEAEAELREIEAALARMRLLQPHPRAVCSP